MAAITIDVSALRPKEELSPHERASEDSLPDKKLPQKSFSWRRDDEIMDSKLSKHRTSCLNFIDWCQKLPFFVRNVLYSLIGCIIFMLPGIFSLLFFVEDRSVYFTQLKPSGNVLVVGNYPYFILGVFLCISWASWFGLRWAFSVLPDVLLRIAELVLGTTTESAGLNIGLKTGHLVVHYIEYLRPLRSYLTFLFWAIASLASWKSIMIKGQGWEDYMTNVLLCLIFAGLVMFIEKLILQIIAVQFHKRAYADRIQESNDSYQALSSLSKSRKAMRIGTGNSETIGELNTVGDNSAFSDFEQKSGKESYGPSAVRQLGQKASDVSKNFFMGLGQVFGAAIGIQLGSSTGLILRNSYDAKILAKKLFESLTRGRNDFITVEDFFPWFEEKDQAVKVFAMFDRDGNGDISKQEMKSVILQIYRERIALEKSLRQSSQAIGKLDSIFKVIAAVIILFISLSIWSVNTSSFLTAVISIWAGLLFAIGGTVKTLIEACIFLFVNHPYDVGDRVDVDGVPYVVKEFGLTSTVFRGMDGKEVYAPNSLLATKFIFNIRRSGPQSEVISIQVSVDTTTEQIAGLKSALVAFLAENSRDYGPQIEPNISQIIDEDRMTLNLNVQFKNNGHDGIRYINRRNRFMFALKKALKDLNIKLPSNDVDVHFEPKNVPNIMKREDSM